MCDTICGFLESLRYEKIGMTLSSIFNDKDFCKTKGNDENKSIAIQMNTRK